MRPRDPSRPRLAALVLAAGGSTRLGRPKQLVRHRGTPLLVRAVQAAVAAAGRPVVVVLGAEAQRLRTVLARRRLPARVVLNARWREGLAGSLAAGLEALPRRAAAALLLVVDQPEVDARALRRLVRAWRGRPGLPAAARYDGLPGVPAILPRRWWRAAKRLEGDQGARALLRALPRITLTDMPQGALDVDAPEDLARLRSGPREPRR
ncbi:MAG TPA: nucleotidyltransferase family protein [Gammaproteobacteria bacterium]